MRKNKGGITNAGLAHEFLTPSRGFTQWFPNTEKGMAAKHADDAERVEIAEQRATVGARREREEEFHARGKTKDDAWYSSV
jgi:hypothetical protein